MNLDVRLPEKTGSNSFSFPLFLPLRDNQRQSFPFELGWDKETTGQGPKGEESRSSTALRIPQNLPESLLWGSIASKPSWTGT